jgi:hypothetical protein
MSILKNCNRYSHINYPNFTINFDKYGNVIFTLHIDTIAHGSRTKLKNHLTNVLNERFAGTIITNKYAFLDNAYCVVDQEFNNLYKSGILKFDPIHQEFFLLNTRKMCRDNQRYLRKFSCQNKISADTENKYKQ